MRWTYKWCVLERRAREKSDTTDHTSRSHNSADTRPPFIEGGGRNWVGSPAYSSRRAQAPAGVAKPAERLRGPSRKRTASRGSTRPSGLEEKVGPAEGQSFRSPRSAAAFRSGGPTFGGSWGPNELHRLGLVCIIRVSRSGSPHRRRQRLPQRHCGRPDREGPGGGRRAACSTPLSPRPVLGASGPEEDRNSSLGADANADTRRVGMARILVPPTRANASFSRLFASLAVAGRAPTTLRPGSG